MSTVIMQPSSSSPFALRPDSMANNNNNYSALRLQNFIGEKKNKLSTTTSFSSPSSSVSLNMFQEHDEEILNNSDIEEFEEFDYDNYNYNNSSEVAEGLGIKLNNNDNLEDNTNIEVNEKEGNDSNENINDNDDNISNDQNNSKLNEKTKKNQAPHFEYVSYDKVQDLYEQRKGHFYFIPEGFEPVLVPNDTSAQTVTNLLESTKPASATPNVSRMLPDTDVRLPSYALPCGVNTNSKKDSANGNKANSKPKKTPRPPNAFILYRRAKQPVIVAQNPGISNNDVSKEIGKMWHEESSEVRHKYQKLAEKAKEEHTKRFPEYKYRPRRPQDKKRHLQPPPPPAHVGKESHKGSEERREGNINIDHNNLNINNVDNSNIDDINFDDDINDFLQHNYNNNGSFYNNDNNYHHQNQEYQLLSTQAQIFYQNQMNAIPQMNAFSAIGNSTDTDLASNDIGGDNNNDNNNQFTTYLQNHNNLMDFSLFQDLPQSHDIDFNNNYSLSLNYDNLFVTKPDY